MSYREKSAWVCLFINLSVWAPALAYVFRLLARHAYTPGSEMVVVIIAIAISTLLIIASHVAISLQSPQEPMDERDRSIESQAAKNAYYVLLALVCIVIFTPTFWWDSFHVPGLTHQSLLLAFVVAETVRFLSQVVYYRRGL